MAAPNFVLDDELVAFVQAGFPTIIGTCDAEGRPSVTRGWGARVEDDRRAMVVFVSTKQSAQCIADLKSHGRIAVTFSRPDDYVTFQLKGRCTSIDEPDEDDRRHVRRYLDALYEALEGIGVSRGLSQRLWCEELTRVTFIIERGYRQTPGPDAGKELAC